MQFTQPIPYIENHSLIYKNGVLSAISAFFDILYYGNLTLLFYIYTFMVYISKTVDTAEVLRSAVCSISTEKKVLLADENHKGYTLFLNSLLVFHNFVPSYATDK